METHKIGSGPTREVETSNDRKQRRKWFKKAPRVGGRNLGKETGSTLFQAPLNNAYTSFGVFLVSWSNMLLQPGAEVCRGMKVSGSHPAWPWGGYYSRTFLIQKKPFSIINNASILTWSLGNFKILVQCQLCDISVAVPPEELFLLDNTAVNLFSRTRTYFLWPFIIKEGKPEV